MKKKFQLSISAMIRNIKQFRFNSIFLRNFVVITTLEIIVILFLTNIYAYQLEKNITEEIIKINDIEQKRSAEVLDSLISQLSDFAYYLSIENDLKLLFFYEELSEESDAYSSLNNMLRSCVRTFPYVSSVYIYMEEARKILTENGIWDQAQIDDNNWLSFYEEIDGPYILRSRCEENKYPFLLTMLHGIKDGKGELIGAVVININLDRLNNALGRSRDDLQKFYMVDRKGELLYSSDTNLVKYRDRIPANLTEWIHEEEGGVIKEEEGVGAIVTSINSSVKNWKYITYSPIDTYYEKLYDMKEKLSYITFFSVIGGIVLSYFLTMQSYRPIQNIMREVEIEDEFIEGDNSKNELQYIAGLIQKTKRKNKELKVEVSDWIARLGQAQVQALQSQINPHFLYNTLDSINWMIIERVGFDNEVSKVVSSLAQLMRISMKRSSYLVSLKEELEHAKLYMELMDIRYPGRIKMHWEVPDKLLDAKVIRLCLQPILENAIRHGLREKRYAGNIYVQGSIIKNTLVITIQDDGTGMCKDECANVNNRLNSEYQIVDKHVGIANVNQRLKILFGDDYGVTLKTGETAGLEVALRFPADKLQDDFLMPQ